MGTERVATQDIPGTPGFVLVLVVVLVLEKWGWGGFDFADMCSKRFLSREYGFCPEGTTGLSPGF